MFLGRASSVLLDASVFEDSGVFSEKVVIREIKHLFSKHSSFHGSWEASRMQRNPSTHATVAQADELLMAPASGVPMKFIGTKC